MESVNQSPHSVSSATVTDEPPAVFWVSMIALNSVLALVLLILFCIGRYDVPPPYLWGIRSGLVIFLAASAIGGVMVAHGSHAVGVKDGGPGLSIVKESPRFWPHFPYDLDFGDLPHPILGVSQKPSPYHYCYRRWLGYLVHRGQPV